MIITPLKLWTPPANGGIVPPWLRIDVPPVKVPEPPIITLPVMPEGDRRV